LIRSRSEAAAWGGELVLSNIRDSGKKAEEESLNGNNIYGVDRSVSINISSQRRKLIVARAIGFGRGCRITSLRIQSAMASPIILPCSALMALNVEKSAVSHAL
jgi:hypothetical protein